MGFAWVRPERPGTSRTPQGIHPIADPRFDRTVTTRGFAPTPPMQYGHAQRRSGAASRFLREPRGPLRVAREIW